MPDPIPFVDLKAQYHRLKDRIHTRIDDVLDHGRFIMGPEIGELEEQLAGFAEVKHAVAVSSGTDALVVALMAEEIGPGDAVFVPAFTFTATAEVVLLLGATPVFVDVDPGTFDMDPADLAARIAAVSGEGRLRPRAIIAVDLFGQPADYPALENLAGQHGLFLLADAAQSLGGSLGNRKIGTLAPTTATSFFPAKPLGGYGDGGALFTDDAARAKLFRSLRVHGQGEAKYDISRVGLNARLDTLQAAILLAKLEIFSDELAARERVAQRYDAALADVVATPVRRPNSTSAWAQYTIQLDDRDGVAASLKASGIPSAVYYPRAMHLQPAYAAYGAGEGSMPVSERLSSRVLSLPMHPYLDEATQARICEGVIAAVKGSAAA